MYLCIYECQGFKKVGMGELIVLQQVRGTENFLL